MSGPLVGIKRHPEFWLDDGNLILVANNDTAFRIYAGFLSSQSDVFAGMFDVASSMATRSTTVALSCPFTIPLENLHTFCASLCQRIRETSTGRLSMLLKLTFDHAAVVRLANKYCLPSDRNQALHIIQSHGFSSEGPRTLRTYPNPTLIVEDIHAIGAINTAHLLAKPILLLLALYRCAILGSAVLQGWTRDDGKVEHLSPADLKLCMNAHAALVRENVRIFAATFQDKPHKHCTQHDECIAGLRALEDAMLRGEFGKHRDVLGRPEMDVTERAVAVGVCGRCQGMLEKRERMLREDAWRRLPEIFGMEVEGW